MSNTVNNPNKTKIITLCGSTKFKDEFDKINTRLTLKGNIVFTITPAQSNITFEQKKILVKMHEEKIKISDEIFVVNPNNYIGYDTIKEIQIALQHGKKVYYLNN